MEKNQIDLCNLVILNNIACDNCDCTDPLIPHKGSEPNDKEPDRLICSKCGKEFAIDMQNRTFERLRDNSITNFIKDFVKVY